jgi:hypothetical protein
MNEQNTAETPAPKPAKARRKPAKARAPRNIDAGIAAIHAEAKRKVAAYRKEKASDRMLRVILEKRLPHMTAAAKQALFDTLAKSCTPDLTPIDSFIKQQTTIAETTKHEQENQEERA